MHLSDKRAFVLLNAVCSSVCFLSAVSSAVTGDRSGVKLHPFLLSEVKLHDTTLQARAAALNTEYLLQLAPDSLLWAFRQNAGLPTPGVPFIGTWEDPYCDLRGHFVGHYLSAISFAAMSTGDAGITGRLQLLVSELRKVQLALGAGGYLSAFPEGLFERLDQLLPVWAPYYTIHKLMAGLVDAHEMGGSGLALTMVKEMSTYFLKRIDHAVAVNGTLHWQRMLDVEYGGMNDVMYRLYRITHDPEHLRMASLFDKDNFYKPLIAGQDVLPGRHANTHLAQVVGFAERYMSVGDDSAAAAVENFFKALIRDHSYSTGGSNAREFWSAPEDMAVSVTEKKTSLETHEICTQYNVLKVARALFQWSADVQVADFYERALLNGILGVSRLTSDDVNEQTSKALSDASSAGPAHGSSSSAHATAASGSGRARRRTDASRGSGSGPTAAQTFIGPTGSAGSASGLQRAGSTEAGVGAGAAGGGGGVRSGSNFDWGDGHHHHLHLLSGKLTDSSNAAHHHRRQRSLIQASASSASTPSSTPTAAQATAATATAAGAGAGTGTGSGSMAGAVTRTRSSSSSGSGRRLQRRLLTVVDDSSSVGIRSEPAVPVSDDEQSHRWYASGGSGSGGGSTGSRDSGAPAAGVHARPEMTHAHADSPKTWGHMSEAERAAMTHSVGLPPNMADGAAASAPVLGAQRDRAPQDPGDESLGRSLAAGRVVGTEQERQARTLLARTADDAAGTSSPGGAVVLSAHSRAHNEDFFDYWGFNIKKIPGSGNATNVAGTPGVYLYLLPMGAGQSKGDNLHHWGYPFHSFWCCYGTAIEAFAKLADSIYFHASPPVAKPTIGTTVRGGSSGGGGSSIGPVLYVAQLVSSTLTWAAQGVVVTQVASLYEPGPSARSTLVVGGFTLGSVSLFTMALRIPGWAKPGATRVLVNGEEWRDCPGPGPPPGTFCSIARQWRVGDTVSLSLGMGIWMSALPDPQRVNPGLQSLMMGPFTMAMHTHDTRMLQLPPGVPVSGGREEVAELARAMEELVSEPGDAGELVSLQAGWNSSVYLRHDGYHMYTSLIGDGGDAIDATFYLLQGCQRPAAGAASASSQQTHGTAAKSGSGSGSGTLDIQSAHHLQMGAHDDVTLSLEALSLPGFFVSSAGGGGIPASSSASPTPASAKGSSASPTPTSTEGSSASPTPTSTEGSSTSPTPAATGNEAVVQQLERGTGPGGGGGGGGRDGAAAERGRALLRGVMPHGEEGGAGWCAGHTFVMRAGLDGQELSISLESVSHPGSFLSAFPPATPAACTDAAPAAACAAATAAGHCVAAPHIMRLRCRASCKACSSLEGVMTVRARVIGSVGFAAASSFKVTTPLAPRAPPGSKVITGRNRRYLASPLGNLVDERYSVYMDLVL
ncbi:MAG: hypothetical protein WDW36_001236 [Sanguina aurantia]